MGGEPNYLHNREAVTVSSASCGRTHHRRTATALPPHYCRTTAALPPCGQPIPDMGGCSNTPFSHSHFYYPSSRKSNIIRTKKTNSYSPSMAHPRKTRYTAKPYLHSLRYRSPTRGPICPYSEVNIVGKLVLNEMIFTKNRPYL